MNTHSTELHPIQETGRDLSSVARIFSGTVAGLATIAADDVPVTQHEIHRICNRLDGIVTALEPQIVLIEQLAKFIHSKLDAVYGYSLSEEIGEEIADGEKALSDLHLMIAELTKIDQSVDLAAEINAHQRHQLHIAHQRAIALAHRGITAIEALAGVIITHDLDAEPPPTRTWDNLDDMLAELKAQPA